MEERNHKPSQSAKAVRKSTIEQSKSNDMRKKEKIKKEVKAKSKTETGNKKQEHSLTRAQNYRQIAVSVPSHPVSVSPKTRKTRVGALRHPLSITPSYKMQERRNRRMFDSYKQPNPLPHHHHHHHNPRLLSHQPFSSNQYRFALFPFYPREINDSRVSCGISGCPHG